MPDPKNFSELYGELQEQLKDSPQYADFLKKLKAVEEKTAALHVKKQGAAPLVTAEDRQQLMDMNMDVGMAAEDVIKNETDKDVREKVRMIAALASGNHAMLKQYDPAVEDKSLPTILEDVRTVTLDLRGAELKGTMGAMSNKRQPVTFLTDKGTPMTGLFTPKKQPHHWNELQADMESIAARCPGAEGKAMVKGFLNRLNNDLDRVAQALGEDSVQKKPGTSENLNDMMVLMMDDNDPDVIDPNKVKKVFKELYKKELRGKNTHSLFDNRTFVEVGKSFEKHFFPVNQNVFVAQIPDGARLDNRNAAMSAAADLLGMPNVVAPAKPMKVITKNGKVVEGTFMTEAKGEDIGNLSGEAANYGASSCSNTSGKGFRDLADLQVLDYVCGNMDRHGANFFYQFDENRKFCGVQGIDNDMSFGTYVPPDNKGRHRMIGPNKMMAISESTYMRIAGLKPEELKFSLRGHGLSEEELDAAGKRLEILQKELEESRKFYADREQRIKDGQNVSDKDKMFIQGKIRIVPDDQWGKLNKQQINELLLVNRKKHAQNLFSLAVMEIRDMRETLDAQTHEKADLKATVAIGEDNRALPGATDRMKQTADLLCEELKRVTVKGWWHLHHGSSKEFDEMTEAVEKYREFQKQLADRMKEANSPENKAEGIYSMDGVVGVNDIDRMAKLHKAMKEKADAYLAAKGPLEGISNPYTRSRVEAAMMVRAFGENGMEKKAAEMDSARMNERRAEESFNRNLSAMPQTQKAAEEKHGPQQGGLVV